MRRGLALSVQTTLSGKTSLDATSSDALLRITAVFVLMTLDIHEHDFLALPVEVGDGVGRAAADHRTERYRVQHFALLIAGAHIRG